MKRKAVSVFLALLLLAAIPVTSASALSFEVVVEPSLQYEFVYDFKEGLAIAWVGPSQGSCFLNPAGKVAIPSNFDLAEPFSEGLACVYTGGKFGYINTSGTFVIPAKYDYAASFSGGLALVRVLVGFTSVYYLIDTAGNIRHTYRPESILDASGIDENGLSIPGEPVVVIMPVYYTEGLIVAARHTHDPGTGGSTYAVGAMDINGNLAIPFEYTNIWQFENGYAIAQKGEGETQTQGIIDKTGRIVIPFDNEGIGQPSEGLVAVRKGGKYGYLDMSGNTVIPFMFDYANRFGSGYAAVEKDGRYELINKKGETVYKFDASYKVYNSISEGYLTVMRDGKWGILKFISDAAEPTKPVPNVNAAPTVKTAPTASAVLVNGKNISFDAYNIGGNNYFKLRDLAYVLNGTEKQFEVTWDAGANAIRLTSGKAYTAIGGEMAAKSSGEKSALPGTATVYLDGKVISLTAYNIDGNNYFKLRDVGQALDFGVAWDAGMVIIDTASGYVPE